MREKAYLWGGGGGRARMGEGASKCHNKDGQRRVRWNIHGTLQKGELGEMEVAELHKLKAC